jgi:phosphatidylglycerophosphatase A
MESAPGYVKSPWVPSPGNSARAAIASALGFGYSPLAPGTVGTLPAVAIFVLMRKLFPAVWETPLITGAFLASCGLSIALGPWAERYWGAKDPGKFVLDEVAGFFLTVLLFRTSGFAGTVVWAFFATRLFDIVKPWPARRLEALPAGWGILMDDLVASLYAAAALHMTAQVFPVLFDW